ncbi:hypothetical protein KSP39_PZI010314 [Platanthera zijinensis]|uniref:Uncharacterized protein n=1 Tax=Platanthera zijinensis TaxID=2320716 RepID=A0AAP0G6F3_9ASPA
MEGRQSWKLGRAHSCPIHSPILMRYSSVHNLQASMESFESDDDSEEMKLHSPPQQPTSSFFTSFIAGHHLSLLPILLILFLLLLSFIYLRPQSPFLWKLSLASAAIAAASLVLKRCKDLEYYFANDQYYEGSWHEGRQQGFGAYTFESGEAMAGEWDCGALKNTLSLADPNVERAVQSNKMANTLCFGSQSAQRALERTLLLPSVEERVEKAVASAEKAAECAQVASVKAVQAGMDGVLCNS